MSIIREKIERVMYSEEKTGHSFSGLILSVFSAMYGASIRIRDVFYLRGIFSQKRLSCRVISIGNITVGGTGKTPMTIYLAKMLTGLGYKVVVVSRGYGGRCEPKQRAHFQPKVRRGGLSAGLASELKTGSIGRRSPAACGGKLQKKGGIVSNGREILMGPDSSGDEPFMMAARLNNIPVVVGQNRYNAGLLAIRNFNPDIILLDDGFQHRKLFRDIDLLLLDSMRPFGNGRLLPRGVLREPVVSIKRADALILTRSSSDNTEARNTISAVSNKQPVFEAYNTFYFFKVEPKQREHSPLLAAGAASELKTDTIPYGRRFPVACIGDLQRGGVSNQAVEFRNKLSEDFSPFAGKKIVAFSGIAGNSHFRKTLEEFKCDLLEFSGFPDHYRYTAGDMERISKSVRDKRAELVMTTEKDFARMAGKFNFPVDIIVVGVKMRFNDEKSFREFILSKL